MDAPEGYEDLVRIDQGGFATLYRAHDTRFDRTVALKVLHAESLNDRQLRRFRAECLAAGRVSAHPNIVTVYDAGTTNGSHPWLAMEYCSGGSLARKVATQGPLPVADVISIGARLCNALSAAHEAGILHRDVKPHNVLVTSYGEPALADFGIASVVVEDDTITETAAYTVVHAAPEVLEGEAGTASADIYSLGSTLYTLLTGKAPFANEAGTGLAPMVARILSNDIPAIERSDVPAELEQLLRASLAAEPQDRPVSAAAFGASLTELGRRLAAESIDQTPSPVALAAARSVPASSRRLLFLLVSALGILPAGFTVWGLTHRVVEPGRLSASAAAAAASPAAAKYAPRNLVVTRSRAKSELIVSWTMPIRPDVVATVIYDRAGAKARAAVSYNTQTVPKATLRGLPSGQEVCLSAAHVVSLGDVVTHALGPVVCAVPR